jgi:hypothetical protein
LFTVLISVSVGGTTGLFSGASLLSMVELIFYLTIRFASNILMNRNKTANRNAEHPASAVLIKGDNSVVVLQQGPYVSSGVGKSVIFDLQK